jgi:DNA polymerase-3 subunit delta
VIYLYHGADSFQIHRAVEAIKQRLDTPDKQLEANTEILDGASITPLDLMQHATALPFLAPARLVIVDGLIAAIASQRAGRGRKKTDDDPLDAWRPAVEQLGAAGALPEQTTLVFIEGDLGERRDEKSARNQAVLRVFAPIAQTVEFKLIKDKEVASWLRDELKTRARLRMNERAVAALVEAVGPDLWALYNELDKLETYAGGEPVDEKVVAAIVAQAREAKMWDLTDAVVAGNERKAIGTLSRLLEEGDPAPVLSSVVARQYRQIAIVKELGAQRASESEISHAAGVPPWKVRQVSSLASSYSWDDIRRAYRLLVDADLSVKRGLQDDESALQLLVHELCGIVPRTSARGRAASR